jgi:hypothetical protein
MCIRAFRLDTGARPPVTFAAGNTTLEHVTSVIRRLVFCLFLPVLAACGDGLGPRFWDATPDTLLIHSASRSEYVGLASAVDVTADPVTPLPIEVPGLSGSWDFALAEEGGGLVLLPAAVIPGTGSRARVGLLQGRDFDMLEEAPRDTTLFSASAVPVRSDAVYVIRSRRANCGFSAGFRYAKLKPVEIDVARGTLRFAIVRNPYCDDRSFVPPDDD